jgi:hypothetical protein
MVIYGVDSSFVRIRQRNVRPRDEPVCCSVLAVGVNESPEKDF